MKRILCLLFVIEALFCDAQNKDIISGYKGDISVKAMLGKHPDLTPAITTSHEYIFDSGIGLGGGIGVILPKISDNNTELILIPYLQGGYYFKSIGSQGLSPFARLKAGIEWGEYGDNETGGLFMPEIGIGKRPFELGFGLDYELISDQKDILKPMVFISIFF